MNTKNDLLPKLIICGYERGGTTLLSDWVRSAGYFSYFEIGVLLFSNSNNFSKERNNPYIKMVKKSLINDDINIDFTSHESIYNSIFQGKNSTKFFDKTPKYMSMLGDVIQRSPFCDKYIVITRDPRNVFQSWAMRNNKSEDIETCIKSNLNQWAKRYLSYYYGCISYIDDDQVLFIKHEDLCLNPIDSKKIIELFLGNKISLDSVIGNKKRSFNNVENAINSDKAFDGITKISATLQNNILKATKEAAPFFFNDARKKQYIKNWYSRYTKAWNLITNFGLKNHSEWVDGKRIDPLFYYLYHDDVLKAGINAVKHFEKHGINKRKSYKVVDSL